MMSPDECLGAIAAQSESVEGSVYRGPAKKKHSASRAVARRFVDLISKDGVDPDVAARMVGTQRRVLMSSKEVREEVQRLVDLGSEVSAELRKKMLRAGWTKMFLDNVDTNPELALKVSDRIAADPEVGLKSDAPAVAVGIQVNMSELTEALGDLDLSDVVVDATKEKE